jgi:hydrogenase expression/formation protein HypC
MCLAIPVRIETVEPNDLAIVNIGGIRKTISVALIDEVAVGDYVILHVGYALNKLDKEEAQKTLELFGELDEHTDDGQGSGL